jgi:ribosomal protein S18 acetylase RimI-like enzyme
LKTGESVTIRSACPDDALDLLALGRAVIAESVYGAVTTDEFDFTEEQERAWIRRHLDDPARVLLVAEISRQVIGMLAVESGQLKRLAHRAVLHMSVKPEWRSRGVGIALLESAIEWARTHPVIEKLCLAVFATNSRAIGLYRKLGFIEEGRRPREIKFGPDQYVDDIQMYRYVKAGRASSSPHASPD